jgi:excinuclease ABC subunit C
VVVPARPADAELLEHVLGHGVRLVVPGGGEKKRMLDVAGDNARVELARREAQRTRDDEAEHGLAAFVDLPEADGSRGPLVIDCFDVSNFQGSNVVASRVRFRGGVADRAGYRRFRVRGVKGQDDFAAMREVVGRALKRGLQEDDLPDLVVIDGGAQQLASALEARDEVGAWDVRVVSLAKARAERRVGGKPRAATEERVYLAPDREPVELPRHSAVRHLFERVRDEAHRFAIAYHRKERGRIQSRLDSIPGIGPARRRALLQRFGSVAGVAQASVEQLAAVPGISPELARLVLERLAQG